MILCIIYPWSQRFATVKLYCVSPGIDEDDMPTEAETGGANIEDMPPLEGEDDSSRMEEVD